MKRNILNSILWVVILFCGLSLFPSSEVLARDRGWHGRTHREVVYVGHNRYHYHGGKFYRPGWFGFEFVLNIPPVGAVVSVLPNGYKTVLIGRDKYYHYNNVYYRTCPTGYVVVSQPVVPAGSLVINVPNSYGGYTAVTLTRHGDGYIGPQGEFYRGNPTVEQLRVLYGR